MTEPGGDGREGHESGSGAARMETLGLVADPDAPHRVVERLARTLSQELGDERGWRVEIEVDPVTAGRGSVDEILRAARQWRRDRQWDYVICVTDLPVRRQGRAILAEADCGERTAVVSLPALGGLRPRRRTRQIVLRLLDEFTVVELSEEYGLDSAMTTLLSPVHRQATTGEGGNVDVRYQATRVRGRIRLLTGMVRANTPWRLVFGLSRALAAAVAASIFGLSSSTIWQLGAELAPPWQVAASTIAIGVLVFWLIAAHGLWETRARVSPRDREQVWLYNVSTVATLTIGVACLYATLFAINLVIAGILVPASLLTSTVGSAAGMTTYVALAWAFTMIGMIAGALGSSLETDQAVRQAAYGYREERRRAERSAEADDQPDRS